MQGTRNFEATFAAVLHLFWGFQAGFSPGNLRARLEVGQQHPAEYLRRIFQQPTITHLAIAEPAFDNAEDLLDLGSTTPCFRLRLFCDDDSEQPRLCLSLAA